MLHHDFRTVLVVVPNGAAVAGFVDVLALVAADHRVRAVFTVAPARNGTTGPDAEMFLRAHGCSVLPWPYATRQEFDLVLTTGSQGLAQLSGKRSLLAVAHESDLTALRESRPEAVPAVVGDLCYDRLLASIPFRAGYRHAFGLSRGQKLVVATSPSGRGLLAGLPPERYRVVVAVAPDVWRPAVVAADLIIADNYGPVTRYGAAIGVPVMVTAAPPSDPRPDGVVRLLSRHARPVRLDRPLPGQVDAAMRSDRSWQDGVAARITARPGQAGEILRTAMYRLLGLAEPEWEVPCFPVPLPLVAHVDMPCGKIAVNGAQIRGSRCYG